ncbi:hypothetical protein [Vibrio breoganii]|uniref:hypothetical protein n=1 Tax=Vibrio breoganii TaxID=553239 RepID=UPI000C81C6D8|nr:hypothetical protein [Vibrio breoganii]PMK30631.1 hypothetical protein BCU03_09445 [Vibrio breoganii]
MMGRKASKYEQIYIEAAMRSTGCLACRVMGHDTDVEPEYLEFHHNPQIGSKDRYAHFYGYPLCPIHHRGAVGMKIPAREPIRHPPLSSKVKFSEVVGDDFSLAKKVWDRLPLEAIDAIGEGLGVWSYEDLNAAWLADHGVS